MLREGIKVQYIGLYVLLVASHGAVKYLFSTERQKYLAPHAAPIAAHNVSAYRGGLDGG